MALVGTANFTHPGLFEGMVVRSLPERPSAQPGLMGQLHCFFSL